MKQMIFEYPCSISTDCHPISKTLSPGKYLLECYGAQGGTGLIDSKLDKPGGKGAYASGVLVLKKRTTFHLYIGGRGENGIDARMVSSKGGWNGGGNSGKDTEETDPDTPGGGGGTTDIRLVIAPTGEESTNEESLNSRIIVAAGGSGSCANAYGAPGGDITGYQISEPNVEEYYPSETSQTTGNRKGKGADGLDNEYIPESGAGGGYYGGNKGETTGEVHVGYKGVSSSGSSYVAGYEGCPSFSHSLGSNFNSVLYHPIIKNGFSSFLKLESYDFEIGHEGNGAIKITTLCSCTPNSCHNVNKIFFCVTTLTLSVL